MGNLYSALFGNKEVRVIIVGLDCSGKTTILYRLLKGEVVPTEVTICINYETVEYKNVNFLMSDIGPYSDKRVMWPHYYFMAQAMIFVIDSTDTDRLAIAKEEFHERLEVEELKGAVILIFANKQDLPGALDDTAIAKALELHKIKSHRWAIFKTSAVNGEGLFEGLDWLSNILKSGGGPGG